MEILGIGLPEFIFVFIIALLILGPKDMQKAGRTIGTFLRKIITSDGWKLFQQTSRDLRTLPNKLIRDANEDLNQINRELKNIASIPNPNPPSTPGGRPQPQPYSATPPAQAVPENSIAPQTEQAKATESDSPTNA